ncbi:hypothetical protein GGR55DRAFT_133998 [Xylaria sp. FL0064]|nr:hypothetical protein GGR55DRAFT_133998 [Xylaria sp. FL0064]
MKRSSSMKLVIAVVHLKFALQYCRGPCSALVFGCRTQQIWILRVQTYIQAPYVARPEQGEGDGANVGSVAGRLPTQEFGNRSTHYLLIRNPHSSTFYSAYSTVTISSCSPCRKESAGELCACTFSGPIHTLCTAAFHAVRFRVTALCSFCTHPTGTSAPEPRKSLNFKRCLGKVVFALLVYMYPSLSFAPLISFSMF